MRWTRVHSVVSVGGVVCAILAYFGAHWLQDEPVQQITSRVSGAGGVAASSGQALPAAVPGAPEYLRTCRGASPFAQSENCYPEPEPEPDPEASNGPPTDGTAMMLPQFENVYVMGAMGDGVVAMALRSAGRALAGTASNNDSVLVDISRAAGDIPVAVSITQALEEGKFVIIDGGDTQASSHKLNEIMADIHLLKIEGVTAYGVEKAKDGAYHVTPLQSLAGANGKRQFDQLHSVLGIKKPGVDS